MPNAPIREAIVDIGVKFSIDLDLAVLRVLKEAVANDYPNQQDLGEAEFNLNLAEGKGQFHGNLLGHIC